MRTFRCRSVDLRVVLVVFTAVSASPLGSVTNAAELNMRPIVTKPEPLKRLHPKLQWMKQKKVRAIWIGDDLFEQIEDDDKTKGQVLRDTGFNLVRISMTVNSDNKPSGVVDTSQPLDVKYGPVEEQRHRNTPGTKYQGGKATRTNDHDRISVRYAPS